MILAVGFAFVCKITSIIIVVAIPHYTFIICYLPSCHFLLLLAFQISISLSSSLCTEANTEKYKDLRALLQLLSSLCSKDLVWFFSVSDC